APHRWRPRAPCRSGGSTGHSSPWASELEYPLPIRAAMELDRLLKFMTDKGASDLHLKPTRPPLLRLSGRLVPIEAPALKREELSEMLLGILTPPQKAKLEEKLSVDIGYGVQGLARFRGNIYVQRGNYAACFRRIPYQIRTLEELELPPVMLEF